MKKISADNQGEQTKDFQEQDLEQQTVGSQQELFLNIIKFKESLFVRSGDVW